MNKFEKLAFENWCKNNLEGAAKQSAIEEILAATGNLPVALELLLGIYELPVIATTPAKPLDYDTRTLFVFLSFNKFTNEVTYGYNKVPTKTCWIVRDSPLPAFEDVTEEMQVYEAASQASRLGLTRDQFNTSYKRVTIYGEPDLVTLHEDTCKLSRWQ